MELPNAPHGEGSISDRRGTLQQRLVRWSRNRTPFSRRWIAFGVGWAILVAALSFFIRVNTTPSVAPGVYLRLHGTPIKLGDYAVACPTPGWETDVALERGYLRAKRFTCDGGTIPLLKRVVAVSGDTVTVNGEGVFRNGTYVAPAPPAQDTDGRPLWTRYGQWVLPEGHLWLGSEIPNGFDSRYLGPFSPEQVVSRAWPLYLF